MTTAQIPQEIQDRYWVNGTFDPVQLPQAEIEELCLALSESDKALDLVE